MRLIDADALEYHEIDEIGGEYNPYLGCSKEYIDRQPTIAVLDKIKAEIMQLDIYYDNDYFSGNRDPMHKCNEVLQIIDKYRKERGEYGNVLFWSFRRNDFSGYFRCRGCGLCS